MIAEFWAEVTALYAGLNLPSFDVSDLHHEGLYAEVALVDDEAGKDDGVACESAKVARPVLGRSDGWSVNHQLVRGFVKCGSSLNSPNIRAVTKFSLGVAPKNIKILDLRYPLGLLIGVAKVLDGYTEHRTMQMDCGEETLEVGSPIDVRRDDQGNVEEVRFVLRVKHIDSLPEVLLLLVGSQIVELDFVDQLRIIPHNINHLFELSLFQLAASNERS